MWKESWELGKNPMASRGSPLHGPRIKLIEQAKNLFGGASKDKESNSLFGETNKDKDFTFELKAAEEHAKLLRLDLTTFGELHC